MHCTAPFFCRKCIAKIAIEWLGVDEIKNSEAVVVSLLICDGDVCYLMRGRKTGTSF